MKPRVLVLLANGFEELECAAFTDVLGWSRAEGEIGVDVIVGALHERVRGTWNLEVIPELVVTSADVASDFDAIAVPGGFEETGYYDDAFDELFTGVIREAHRQGKPVASVCVGALPVAKSGILNGREATTYHTIGVRRMEQLEDFGATPKKEAMVISDRIITSCGPSTAVTVALTLLEMLTGRKNRIAVEKAMGFARQPSGDRRNEG